MPINRRYSPSLPLLGRVAQIAGEGRYRTDELNPLALADAQRNVNKDLRLLALQEDARQSNQRIAASQLAQQAQLAAQQQQAALERQQQQQLARFNRMANLERLQLGNAAQRQRDFRQAELSRRQQELGFRQDLTRDQLGFDNRLLFQDRELTGQEFMQNVRNEQQYNQLVAQAKQQGFDFSPEDQRELQSIRSRIAGIRETREEGLIGEQEFRRQMSHQYERMFRIRPTHRPTPFAEQMASPNGVWKDKDSGHLFIRWPDGSYDVRPLPDDPQMKMQEQYQKALGAYHNNMFKWNEKLADYVTAQAANMVPPEQAAMDFQRIIPPPEKPTLAAFQGMQAGAQQAPTQPPMQPPMDPAVSSLMGGQAPQQPVQAPVPQQPQTAGTLNEQDHQQQWSYAQQVYEQLGIEMPFTGWINLMVPMPSDKTQLKFGQVYDVPYGGQRWRGVWKGDTMDLLIREK